MKSHHWSQARFSAFTLIELLVVIAVISLLAAILFPVFARARDNARKTSCLNNQKQISLAMLQYSQDFDQRFPLLGSSTYQGWAATIEPYTKSVQLYQCPSELRKPNYSKPSNDPNSFFTDYAMNNNTAGLQESILLFPASTVQTGDALGGVDRNGSREELLDGSTAQLVPRHLQGNNYSFCDGHAKWLPVGKVLGGNIADSPNPCLKITGKHLPNGSNFTYCP